VRPAGAHEANRVEARGLRVTWGRYPCREALRLVVVAEPGNRWPLVGRDGEMAVLDEELGSSRTSSSPSLPAPG